MILRALSVAASILLGLPVILLADTIHVPADHPTIQEAIDAAANGDVVLAAQGTYVENIDFKGKAITVKSTGGAVIDGSQPSDPDIASVVIFRNGEVRDSVLEGFTITGGTGTYHEYSPNFSKVRGGGILCEHASPWIRNCVITLNSTEYGGGLYGATSAFKLTQCIFSQNRSTEDGGGVFLESCSPEITDCAFLDNEARDGGGMYTQISLPQIAECVFKGNLGTYFGGGLASYGTIAGHSIKVIRCTFLENTAHLGGSGIYNMKCSPTVIDCRFIKNWVRRQDGGAMYNYWGSSPVVTDCLFEGNASGGWCGAMNNNYHSSPTLERCRFIANWAKGRAGGLLNAANCSPTLNNCLFFGNAAGEIGGGMYNLFDASPTLINCTFFMNTAGANGGAMACSHTSTPEIVNSILWEDRSGTPPGIVDEIFIEDDAEARVEFSNVQGGYKGYGNLDSDPLFANGPLGDFHLLHPSPCRDAGDNAFVTAVHDFEGDPRIDSGKVDLGCDEFHTHLYCTGDPTPGGLIQGMFVGRPGTAPVGLWFGSGLLDPPLPSPLGNWYLEPPLLFLGPLGTIPASGLVALPATVPNLPPAPYDLYMQAIIGGALTNPCVLEIR